jgi:trans-aconitate methyltransferase
LGAAQERLCVLFVDLLGAESVFGLDISSRSLDVAKRTKNSERAHFLLLNQYKPKEEIDLAFCNGVFHHISVNRRGAAVNYIHRSVRLAGLFALWENNP